MTAEWLKIVARSALCNIETLEATYDIAVSLLNRGIQGDFAECGVYAGAHCAVMARALMDRPGWGGPPGSRYVHLFDTFTGIPLAGPNDIEFLAANKPEGESACSRQHVEANMEAWGIPDGFLIYHEGLFQDTVPIAKYALMADIRSIALLRLDGDLYESTKPCIEYLLPLVSRGGWVIVDDFNLSGCRQAVMEKIVPAPIYFRIPTK